MKALAVLPVLSLCFLPFPLLAADLDNDGIDDDQEHALITECLPLIYFHDEEACPGPGVLLYRVRPYAPGVDTVLSASIVLLFYEDCGMIGHDGDAESFALTLWKDPSCSLGYRVHSLRTYAHLGNTFCSLALTTGIDRCEYGASEGDYVYVSRNTHAVYMWRAYCNDPDRFFCGDSCAASLVMNDGSLYPAEVGQSWRMHNVGEPDHPFIQDLSEINGEGVDFASSPIWDYRPFCGDEPFHQGDYCPANIVPKLFQCSSGPSLPVSVALLGSGGVPSPMGYCRDQFLYLDLPYGGNVVAHIYNIAGDVVDKVYLPPFCPLDEVLVPYWDGRAMDGACASPGTYYLLADAFRGDNSALSDLELFGIAGDEPRPSAPSDLAGTGTSSSVSLTWTDHSGIEEAFILERSLGTCPYAVIATLPANTTSYVDHPGYEGVARYRVMAHRTYGGNSAFSNEVELDLMWNISAPFLRAGEAPGNHAHNFSWHFDPGEMPFDWYIFHMRFKYAIGAIADGEVPADWSAWFALYETGYLNDTLFVHAPVDDKCYEYRVDAIVNGWADTLKSNVRNFHGQCEPECPILFHKSGEGERRITNLFPSIEHLPSSRNIPDAVCLGELEVEEVCTLKIEEMGGDTSFIDSASLFSIPSEEGLAYGLTPLGRAVAYGRSIPPSRAVDETGRDMESFVREEDGIVFKGDAGSTLVLEFPRGDGDDTLFGMLNPVDPVKAVGPGIYIDRGSDREQWTHVETVYPHRDGAAVLVNLAPFLRKGEAVKVRLECVRWTLIDQLFLTSGSDETMRREELPLLRAITDEGMDVTGSLIRADEDCVRLEHGEAFFLLFRRVTAHDGRRRYFLEANGRYTKRAPCTPVAH